MCSIRLCSSHSPGSPDDPAAHLSRLLWVHKHIQRHIRGALALWLTGWGFMGLTFKPPPLPCLLNHKQTTTSHRSYCGALRWHHLRPHRQPPPPQPQPQVQSQFLDSSVDDSHSSGLCIQYISIYSCCWPDARCRWGERCWWLWLVLDGGQEWRGSLDELAPAVRG